MIHRREPMDEVNSGSSKCPPAYLLSQEIYSSHGVSQKYQRSNVGQFMNLMRPVAILGNCLGLMPLKNFSATDAVALKFVWKSGVFLYSMVIQCAILILCLTSFYKQFSTGVEFNKLQNLIHYTVAFLTYLNFVVLANHWRELIYCWESNEWLLLQEIDENYNPKQLKQKSLIIVIGYFSVGAVLQCMWQLVIYYNTTECDGFTSRTHAFLSNSFPELFAVIPYNRLVGFCAVITQFLCEFAHIYLNVFLIIVCLSLKEQFVILNQRVIRTPFDVINENYWQQKWSIYKRIVNLLQLVNRRIDFFLILSYGSNLFDICVQLLFSMRKKSSIVQGLYAWCSLLHLIVRVLSLSLAAASVYEESNRIVHFIRNLPTSLWNIEVQRFLEHLTNERVALSGMQFFTITKSLILKMIGTIVTYELVMLKFKQAEEENHVDKNPCL